MQDDSTDLTSYTFSTDKNPGYKRTNQNVNETFHLRKGLRTICIRSLHALTGFRLVFKTEVIWGALKSVGPFPEN